MMAAMLATSRHPTPERMILMHPYSIKQPYFPQDLPNYAPWVAKHGLLAPYGECQCGCGQSTKIAYRTDTQMGWLKEQSVAYIRGHSGGRGYGKILDDKFWEKVDRSDGCWIWQGSLNNRGYGQINLDGKRQLAHRVSWEMANGPIESGLNVLHHCDNPPCIRPDHLFLGTSQDNALDMVSKGRHKGNPNGKTPKPNLDASQVTAIRELYKTGKYSQSELGERFGMCRMTINNIVNRRTWRTLS